MLFEPQIPELRNHIDNYWIINDMSKLFPEGKMYAYPGITPDMIIVLDGYYSMDYMGKQYRSNKSQLFSFIHQKVLMDLSKLKKCIIIKFKSRGLSSLLPFVNYKSDALMRNSIANTEDVLKIKLEAFENHLKTLSLQEILVALDDWFFKHYKKEREGFVVEMAQEISADFDLKTIMNATNYSYSTIERYFKHETGLTPKKFQSLKRYKKTIRELYTTQNTDWQHYILKYGYHDQSHFIKDIKRYTSFTPSQLLNNQAFIQIRPNYS